MLRVNPACKCGAIRNCVCDIASKTAILVEEEKLMQFLMGFHEGFEGARS